MWKKEEIFLYLASFLNILCFLLVIAIANLHCNLTCGYFSESGFYIHTHIYSRCLIWRKLLCLGFFSRLCHIHSHLVNEVAFPFPFLQTANKNSKYEAILCVKLIGILRWFPVILLLLCVSAFWQCRMDQYFQKQEEGTLWDMQHEGVLK